ncbi:Potassium-transporting ATPase KdpC subunit [bioreactor metagenome]|uniref:Potassium-transporting ATPase KdpC subunit n=1 Tax=bioreactor metagenome TaxID=1076179 RepID=A0A645CTA4_9ZZZZ
MNRTFKTLRTSFITLLVFTILCGVVYTMTVTIIGQALFPTQANGSIVSVVSADGTKTNIGSSLIGQTFTDDKYLIGRPTTVSNLSPVSQQEIMLGNERIMQWKELDPNNDLLIPADLVMASGSGADPYISPEAAEYQVERIARIRKISEEQVRQIIKRYTVDKLLGIWGESGVNVLLVNLALDGLI